MTKYISLLIFFMAVFWCVEAIAAPGDGLLDGINNAIDSLIDFAVDFIDQVIIQFFRNIFCELGSFFPENWNLRCSG